MNGGELVFLKTVMIRYWIILILIALIGSCKSKKTSLTDSDLVEAIEFIEFFPEVTLPFVIGDTTVRRKQTDSSLISYKIFTQFIADSVLQKDFGKTANPKLYPLGRAAEKGKETYLFLKATQGNKRVGYIICFDNKNEFKKALPIVRSGFDNSTSAYGALDRKFQITTYRERKEPNDNIEFKRNIYIYNSAANDFTLILTEPNEEIIEKIINPIDTLSKKNKYAGDYIKDKRNFISVRDGKNPSEILFFVHFEKNNAACVGELKGSARFISANLAQHKENGNPCTLQFAFTARGVTMKEIEGCGSYRDIKCLFEGSFPKKTIPKPKPPKKKK